MELYSNGGVVPYENRLGVTINCLEQKVAKNWEIAKQTLINARVVLVVWHRFKNCMIQTYGNVHEGFVESYDHNFQNLCLNIVTLPHFIGDKITLFMKCLKQRICFVSGN